MVSWLPNPIVGESEDVWGDEQNAKNDQITDAIDDVIAVLPSKQDVATLDQSVATLGADPASQIAAQQRALIASETEGEFALLDNDGKVLQNGTPLDDIYQPIGGGTTPGPQFNDLTYPVFIPHRGAALVAPENTMTAYRAMHAAGHRLLEADVYLLADGSLAVMHDSTVDRTTITTGATDKHTSATWKSLRINAPGIVGGGYTQTTEAPPLLDEVVREFGNKSILVIEAKNTGAMAAIMALLAAHGVAKQSVILQSFTQADATAAAAAGYPALWLGTTNYTAAAAAGIQWIGPAKANVTSTLCTNAHAAGVKVVTYTVNRRYEWDALAAMGCDGTFSDDPDYVSRRISLKTDLYTSKSWAPGQQANSTSTRGNWTADGWGIVKDATAGVSHLVNQGYLTPTNPSSFVLDLEMKITDPVNTGRWGSVWLSPNDFPFVDAAADGAFGYHLLLRASGEMHIYKVVNNTAAAVLVALGTGLSATTGLWVPVRITVTATQITFRRNDTAQQISVTDSSYRPLRQIAFGASQADVRFRNAVVN